MLMWWKVYSKGPLHDPVTWLKITHAGEQLAQRDFPSNATHTNPPGPAFVLEVPLRNLLTSVCDFVYPVTGSCKGPTPYLLEQVDSKRG